VEAINLGAFQQPPLDSFGDELDAVVRADEDRSAPMAKRRCEGAHHVLGEVSFMLKVLRNRRTGVSVFVPPAYLDGGT